MCAFFVIPEMSFIFKRAFTVFLRTLMFYFRMNLHMYIHWSTVWKSIFTQGAVIDFYLLIKACLIALNSLMDIEAQNVLEILTTKSAGPWFLISMGVKVKKKVVLNVKSLLVTLWTDYLKFIVHLLFGNLFRHNLEQNWSRTFSFPTTTREQKIETWVVWMFLLSLEEVLCWCD